MEKLSSENNEAIESILNKLENSPEFEGYNICKRLEVNGQIYICGAGQFSKIENGKYIEICNWLKPVYDTKFRGNISLFDLLFDGIIHDMSFTKNKKYIHFDSYNCVESRNTKYDFNNNIFYVKFFGNPESSFESDSREALKVISKTEKDFKIKISQ